ncbi:hypothetical protein WA171_004991, partial [Blastocystis sp. BT1]
DLNVDEFSLEVPSSLQKRSNDSPTQSSPKKIAVESTSDVSLMTQQPKHKTDTNDNTKTKIKCSDYSTRWEYVMALLQSNGTIDASLHDYTSIADIRANHFTRSDRMLLQIESIRKTETGFLCEFSDRANRIFGTLSNHIVKDHQRVLDVTTVLWLKNVPILYVNQSGNIYLVINSDNIVKVYSRFDET